MTGRSSVEHVGDEVSWTLVARDDNQEGVTTEEAEAVQSLFTGSVKIFLRHGRFLRSAGVDLSDDDRVATLKEDLDEETVKSDEGTETIRLALTWTNVEATKAGR